MDSSGNGSAGRLYFRYIWRSYLFARIYSFLSCFFLPLETMHISPIPPPPMSNLPLFQGGREGMRSMWGGGEAKQARRREWNHAQHRNLEWQTEPEQNVGGDLLMIMSISLFFFFWREGREKRGVFFFSRALSNCCFLRPFWSISSTSRAISVG